MLQVDHSNIKDLPNELLPWIVSHLEGSAIFALTKSCKDLDFRLQPSIWRYNIKFQNSNLLHLAVKDDNVDLAAALLQHNANINAFYRGKTPLMRAFQYSSAAMRELLLNRRELEINIQNQARETALWYAIHYGNYFMVKRFLEQPKVRDTLLPLYQIVAYGSFAAVWRLLRRTDSTLDTQNRKGYILLYLVVYSNRFKIVDLLLRHLCANVNCIDKDRNMSLWFSTYSSYYEITKRLLVEKSINVKLIGGHRRFEILSTSLHHAAARLDIVLLRRLLVVAEIDPNICITGHSLISITTSCRLVSAVTYLLNIGSIEINGRGFINLSICQAVVYGHYDVVMLLVQEGICLSFNESMVVFYDTILCITVCDSDLDIV
ncbi:unnamed protein product [Penicillium salamii]|nr:unnamed protein product [Penicillium salamii]